MQLGLGASVSYDGWGIGPCDGGVYARVRLPTFWDQTNCPLFVASGEQRGVCEKRLQRPGGWQSRGPRPSQSHALRFFEDRGIEIRPVGGTNSGRSKDGLSESMGWSPSSQTAGGLQAKVTFSLRGNHWKSSAHSGASQRWENAAGTLTVGDPRRVAPPGSEFQSCSVRGVGVGESPLRDTV